MTTLFLTETLLYLSLSFLVGLLVVELVPAKMKPTVEIKKSWMAYAVAGIVIFSFAPLFPLVVRLSETTGIGNATWQVLTDFTAGQAWLATLAVSIAFFILIFFSKGREWAASGLLLALAFIVTLGWSSHSESISPSLGILYHSMHLIAVSVWVGTLLVISFLAKNEDNWALFLKWFTPLAISCFTLTIVSGYLMMTLMVDITQYTSSWSSNYGHTLLIKHLLFIPVFLFACINGFWVKKMLKNASYRPIVWARTESVLLFLIFTVTAVMGQQAPPHDISNTLRIDGVSPLYLMMTGSNSDAVIPVVLEWNLLVLMLGGLSVVFIWLFFLSFSRKAPAIFTLFIGLFLSLSLYLMLMVSVT